MTNTPVYLDEKEVRLFKEYCYNRDVFILLAEAGVFSFKGGEVVIHKDKSGGIGSIVGKREIPSKLPLLRKKVEIVSVLYQR